MEHRTIEVIATDIDILSKLNTTFYGIEKSTEKLDMSVDEDLRLQYAIWTCVANLQKNIVGRAKIVQALRDTLNQAGLDIEAHFY